MVSLVLNWEWRLIGVIPYMIFQICIKFDIFDSKRINHFSRFMHVLHEPGFQRVRQNVGNKMYFLINF